jgi:hypothetical protein
VFAWTIITHVSMPLGEHWNIFVELLNFNLNFLPQPYFIASTARCVYAIYGSVHGRWNRRICKELNFVIVLWKTNFVLCSMKITMTVAICDTKVPFRLSFNKQYFTPEFNIMADYLMLLSKLSHPHILKL